MHRASARILLLALALAATLAFAVACDDAEDAPTETATATGTTTTDATGDATPGGEESDAYAQVAEDVTNAFDGQDIIEDVTSYSAGGGALLGQGRRILLRGTAEDLPPFVEVATTLRGVLEAAGWQEDVQYAADGPTGTMSVYRRDEDLAVLAAAISTADPNACPADQPISACLDTLAPSELNIQGEIVVADRQ